MKSYEGYIDTIKGKMEESDEILGIEPFARMATEMEFKSKLIKISPEETNVPPGIAMYQDDDSVYIRPEMNHVLLTGLTGTGKSVTALWQIGSYWSRTRCPIIYEDPKGEHLALTGKMYEEMGYEVQVIYLREPTKGIRVNPLAEINKKLRSDDLKVKEEGELELADLLYGMIVEGTAEDDAYWAKNPWQFACGLTKELISRVDDVEITIPMLKVAADMIVTNNEKMQEFKDTLDDDNPYLAEMLNMLSVTSDSTRSGMSGYLQMGFSFCKSHGMIDLLSGDELDVHAIASGKPVALYIVSPDNTAIYDSLVSVILGQIIHTLYSDADTKYGGKLPKDVLFILDEFANIPKIPAMEKIITTARSRRLRFVISVQSINQLYCRYGSAADVIVDNCKDWVCTAADPIFSRKLDDKLGRNAAGKPIITHNILRCLPPGRPLVVLERFNPFITTLQMADVAPSPYPLEDRIEIRKPAVDLETLIFHPELLENGSEVEKTAVNVDDFDLDIDNPTTCDWTDSQDELHDEIINCIQRFNLLSSTITNEDALRTAVLMHCMAMGIYKGQAIKVDALMKFQEVMNTELEFIQLMELVSIVVNSDDYEGSATSILESNENLKGVRKSTLKKIIKDMCKELFFLRTETDEENDDSEEDLKVDNPFAIHEIYVINGCLDGLRLKEMDVTELSYGILEALILRHKTKEKILERKGDYESIIHLYHPSVIDSF